MLGLGGGRCECVEAQKLPLTHLRKCLKACKDASELLSFTYEGLVLFSQFPVFLINTFSSWLALLENTAVSGMCSEKFTNDLLKGKM